VLDKFLPPAAIKEAIILAAASVVLGIAANYLNPRGIELCANGSTTSVSDSLLSADSVDLTEPIVISTMQVIRLKQSGNALFIDARERPDYEKGHIPGAILLPYETFFEHEDVIDSLPNDKWLICYCDGPPCDLGQLLAYELFMRGFKQTAIYESGLNEWTKSEKVETGLEVSSLQSR
jgi:rhodanese-related sulfurtransferase